MLIYMGLFAGICAGAAAILYRLALSGANSLRERWLEQMNGPWEILLMFLVLLTVGFITGLLVKAEPLSSGSGIPQVEGQLMGYFSPKWGKVLGLKFIGGFLSLLCGLSLGREGPSVQLGAMAAQGYCEKLNRSNTEKKYLITCGACAGLAAAFNAPLAGIMFGMEEIHKNFSSRALFSTMIACISAAIFSSLVFGNGSALALRPESALPMRYYHLLLIAGVFFGLMSCLHNKLLFFIKTRYAKSKHPLPVKLACTFALAGIVALTVPDALGSGEHIITKLSVYGYTTGFLLLLFAVKFLFTMICAGSGAPGGTLVTMLVLGALSGAVFSEFAEAVFHMPDQYTFCLVLMGMTGLFAGCVRAPLTAILLIVELSGSLTHFLELAIVAFLAVLVADLLKVKPLYEKLLDDMIPENLSRPPSKELSTIELTVSYRNHMVGKTLRSLELPSEYLIVSIDRQGTQLVPRGTTEIRAGDLLTVLCPAGEEGIARTRLGYGGDPDQGTEDIM